MRISERNEQFERETEMKSLRRFVRQLEKPENTVAAMVAEALDRELTPRQKEMVKMYYIDQLKMCHIARELGVNPSTVTRTLQQARAKLEAALGYCGRILAAVERDEQL